MNWGLYNDHTLVSRHNTYIEALETALSQHKQNGAEYDVKPAGYKEQAKSHIGRTVQTDFSDSYFNSRNRNMVGTKITNVYETDFTNSIAVEVRYPDGRNDLAVLNGWPSTVNHLERWTRVAAVKPTEQPAEPQKRPVYIETADRQYDMSNLALSALAVTDDGIIKHTEPVSSIDDAKQKLDALNVGMPPVCGRYHGQVVPLNNPEFSVWVSPDFDVSHIYEYFQLLKENGGYTTHAEYELAKSGWVYTGDQRKDGF